MTRAPMTTPRLVYYASQLSDTQLVALIDHLGLWVEVAEHKDVPPELEIPAEASRKEERHRRRN